MRHTDPMSDSDADRLAAPSLAAGDPTGWFDALYREAAAGAAVVPWDAESANPLLVQWAEPPAGDGDRAVVVGCGLGRDAAHVAGLGWATTAFDVSPAAVEGARRRWPDAPIDWTVANLLDLPPGWARSFQLVIESHTVQSLPPSLHAAASAAVASLVAPGGTLLVLAMIGTDRLPVEGPPWPLTARELDGFAVAGTRERSRERVPAEPDRWRAVFHRPAQP